MFYQQGREGGEVRGKRLVGMESKKIQGPKFSV